MIFFGASELTALIIIFLLLETDCRNSDSVYNEAHEVMDVMKCSRSNECDERLKK
jgi:hypothetical protein